MATHLSPSDQIRDRTPLADRLPLPCPMNIVMTVSNACNFHCYFCPKSLPPAELHRLDPSVGRNLSVEDFQAFLAGMGALGRLKTLILAGTGEPLMNPNLVEMVRLARESGVAERIDMITNASLLTPQMSDALVRAGLNRLRVSLEGLSAEDYHKSSGVSLDYNLLVENLRYFYQHKGNCRVYIKIMDVMLQGQKDLAHFHQLFDGVADELAVESLVPINKMTLPDSSRGKLGISRAAFRVCSYPFYTLTIAADGFVYPCCYLPYPEPLGHVKDGLEHIWGGKRHKELILRLLDDDKAGLRCENCDDFQYALTPAEYLDDHISALKERYEHWN